MISILVLSLQAFTRARRLIVVGLLLAVPALLALVYRGSEPRPDGPLFAVQMVDNLLLPVLIPLTALILGSSVLGNEIEDGTLLYLTLRPVARLWITLGKLLAVVLITLILVEVSVLLTALIAMQGFGTSHVLAAGLIGGLAGTVAYCSLFVPLGLFAPRRGLIIGLAYVLVWEVTVAGLSTALATLSIRRYVLGTIDATLQSARLIKVDRAQVDGLASLVVLAIVVIAAVAVTTWRLQRMEIS